MMASVETLQAVVSLASLIPGVSVLDSEMLATDARIHLLASSDRAIVALQQAALASNANVDPWLPDNSESNATRQTITATTDSRDGLEYGELQMLGIHLVWHLHSVGLLANADANARLDQWGAARVGA